MSDAQGSDGTGGGDISAERIDALHQKLDAEAEAAGYHLNPDVAFTRDLVRGLLVNEERYGYWACPCRLADGDADADRDIVCPCDYRDADLDEFDMCYCALYVSDRVLSGEVQTGPIPERRSVAEDSGAEHEAPGTAETPEAPGAPESLDARRAARVAEAREAPRAGSHARPDPGALSQPVWRCRVCGYLCARERPPLVCPICKAKQDRFERFM